MWTSTSMSSPSLSSRAARRLIVVAPLCVPRACPLSAASLSARGALRPAWTRSLASLPSTPPSPSSSRGAASQRRPLPPFAGLSRHLPVRLTDDPLLFQQPNRLLSSSLSSSSAPPTPSSSSSPPSISHPHSVPSTLSTPSPSSASSPSSSTSRWTPIAAAPSSSSSTSLHSGPAESDSSSAAAGAAASPAGESQLRRLFRQYGVVAVGSYLTIYLGTLGMLYVAVKERWMGGVDVQHWMEWLGAGAWMEDLDPRKGDLAVAWIATKLTEPLRLALTAALTPTVARWLGRAPPKEHSITERVREAALRAKEGLADATARAGKDSEPSTAADEQLQQQLTRANTSADAVPAAAAATATSASAPVSPSSRSSHPSQPPTAPTAPTT